MTPFPFDKIKKLTLEQVHFTNQLVKFGPVTEAKNSLLEEIGKVIHKTLKANLELFFESFFETTHARYVAGLPKYFSGFLITVQGSPAPLLLEIDYQLAAALIDKLIGGAPAGPFAMRALTNVEEGVLEFLMAKVLSLLNGSNLANPMSLSKIVSEESEVASLNDDAEGMLLITYRARFQNISGYVRLVLPKDFVSQWMMASTGKNKPLEGEDELKNFGHFRTVLWGEIGNVTLSAQELNQLEAGDIILFDQCYSDYDGKNLSGSLVLRMGDGSGGGIHTLIEADDKAICRLKVQTIFTE